MSERGEAVTIGRLGRAGLKLPELATARDPNTLDYFRSIFDANGYDTQLRYSGHRVKFSHEFAIPATDRKPFVLLRGKYVDVRKEELPYRPDEFGLNQMTIMGYESYEVLIPPTDTAGPLQTIIEVSLTDVTGSGHPNAFPDTELSYNGEELWPPHFSSDDAYLRAKQDVLSVFEGLVS